MKKFGYLVLAGFLLLMTACNATNVSNNLVTGNDSVSGSQNEVNDGGLDENPEITEGASMTEYPGIADEDIETMKAKMANYKNVLDEDAEIDPLYVSFLLGESFLPYMVYNITFDCSSYSINDKLFESFFEADAYYTLYDVNGDGVKELYYKIEDTDTSTLYAYVIGITDEGTPKIYESQISYNLHFDFYLNGDGYWILESNLDETDSFYSVYSFDSEGNMIVVEEISSNDYEDYEDYISAYEKIASKYGNDDSLDLKILSEGIMG